MKLKKIPLYLLILLLTLGAALTLGFLSFTGMLSLWPILPLAIIAFVLAVGYESEIYSANIKRSLNKLLKHDYLKRYLANQFLLKNFPIREEDSPLSEEDHDAQLPLFFQDYKKQLKKVHSIKHAQQKNKAKKKLKAMEDWFAQQLYLQAYGGSAQTKYEQELADWLKKHKQAELEEFARLYQRRKATYHYVKAFALVSGVAMGMGTAYLLAEAILAVPLLASLLASPMIALPIIGLILAACVVSGAAYALLTYNSVTDMINHEVFWKWFQLIKERSRKGLTLGNVFLLIGTGLLVSLAVVLTIFTAGNWWTIGKHVLPLIPLLGKLPPLIKQGFIPVTMGASTFPNNLINALQSGGYLWYFIKNLIKKIPKLKSITIKTIEEIEKKENKGQIFNPFRILLLLTFVPTRMILFLGHLVSIAATADQVPGVPSFLSALIGFICEFFEDLHYFFGFLIEHNHKKNFASKLAKRLDETAGHSHDNDIPTQVLKIVFTPLYLLSISWDYYFSRKNKDSDRKVLGFVEACKKQHLFIFDLIPLLEKIGLKKSPEPNEAEKDADTICDLSESWQQTYVQFKTSRFLEKQGSFTLIQREVHKEKRDGLMSIATAKNPKACLKEERTKPIYGRHRYNIFHQPDLPKTQQFLNTMARDVGVSPA